MVFAMPRIGTASRNGGTVLGRSRRGLEAVGLAATGGATAGLESALRSVRSEIARPGREDAIRPNQKMDLCRLLIGCCLISAG
jgi:hypothetical protein